MNNSIGHVAICIATYKRPADLQRLLDSLEVAIRAAQSRASVIVVDNDSEESASEVTRSHALRPQYLVEVTPGIAAARNHAIDALGPDVDWIAFVDDDEEVESDWLVRYELYVRENEPQVVTGPVISVLPRETPRWINQGGFIQRPIFPAGAYPWLPATNNTIVRAKLFQGDAQMRFSERYSLSGGSDTELFLRLRERGVTFEYCPGAIVRENVPASRATARWVWQRGVRSGNVAARLLLERTSRLRVFIGGAARVFAGALRTAAAVLTGKGFRHRDFNLVMRGFGFLKAAFGRVHIEYARAVAGKV